MYHCEGSGCTAAFPSVGSRTRHERRCLFVANSTKRLNNDARTRMQERKRARIEVGRAMPRVIVPAEMPPPETYGPQRDEFTESLQAWDAEPSEEERPSPQPILSAAGRPVRPRILPKRFRQLSPPRNNLRIDPEDEDPATVEALDEEEESPGLKFEIIRTQRNKFRIHRVIRRPKILLDDRRHKHPPVEDPNVYAPLPNRSTYLLFHWFWSSSHTKSFADLLRLQEITRDSQWRWEDFANADLRPLNRALVDGTLDDDRWVETSVPLSVPIGHLHPDVPGAVTYEVKGLHYRPLTSVIQSVFRSSQLSEGFCYEPYELRYTPLSADEDIAVHGELFWSSSFRNAHDEVQRVPQADGDSIPHAVAAMQLWSDSMSATKFGSAKLWPIYLQFGNQSKYRRSCARSGAIHSIAFIPSLPSDFKEFVERHARGKKTSAELELHCRREIMQAVWLTLLDDEFINAWKTGIVVLCGDGVLRRLFPRILTYSADYPEKVLLATMKFLGSFPCPRCLIPASKILSSLGKPRDMRYRIKYRRTDNPDRQYRVNKARELIYTSRKRLTHPRVKLHLDPHSLTPVENAFSKRLGPLGFDFHDILVVDILHEWEVGVWKTIFTHLVRIINTFKDRDRLNELNKRVREVPAFGSDIRSYKGNISDMKQMTGYNFEDLLQCALPVFDGLFPQPHETIIRILIYRTVNLHALCKLRLHTDDTIAALHSETRRFGDALRKFASDTCPVFATTELAAETRRRVSRMAKKRGGNDTQQTRTSGSDGINANVKKAFNANTSKVHAVGHYAKQIVEYGTTDSYSTNIGESEHKMTKDSYARTNGVNPEQQITRINQRQANLARISGRTMNENDHPGVEEEEEEDVELAPGDVRYSIGQRGIPINLPQ
ncbi:uncharacterized protein FOMMEDRAFT_112387 [Fomitiporia mediterranea MF3/22]|uniref:uncharacterized protein n=1 Tax=Fomitiporia mediterranea (strain MF3/22) TaxID=694068 RepID=UPI000440961F|nr:uncharacterized protein FOMMEDRAFT_112387 [Fomitiporia mediterranea MF3/22]EJD00044.1 hypothetical protein FOMMEDRAFT_112387 [Fomitiporia mediterranea MF3/22]